jgi:hypothetical protein
MCCGRAAIAQCSPPLQLTAQNTASPPNIRYQLGFPLAKYSTKIRCQNMAGTTMLCGLFSLLAI